MLRKTDKILLLSLNLRKDMQLLLLQCCSDFIADKSVNRMLYI